MATPRSKPLSWFAALLCWLAVGGAGRAEAAASSTPSRTSLRGCIPAGGRRRCREANPIDITVIVSFNREGAILGHPRITYESEHASDNDRLEYRIAVMETLQRCTPLPFTEGLGGAVAGRPFAIPFRTRKRPPKPEEKRAWLLQKIL